MAPSLAVLAAEATNPGLLYTLLYSPAMVALFVAAPILFTGWMFVKAIKGLTTAKEREAAALEEANRINAGRSDACRQPDVREDIRTLYENDGALAQGIRQVARQTGAEVTVAIAGNTFMRHTAPPAGATWAPEADVNAARMAAMNGTAAMQAATNRYGDSGTQAALATTGVMELARPTADEIMRSALELTGTRFNMFPWDKLDHQGAIANPGCTTYYDVVRSDLESHFQLHLPEDVNELWDRLHPDTKLEFQAMIQQ